MGIITLAVFAVLFLLLWGKIFHHLHTHKDALSSLGVEGLTDSLFLKGLISFVGAAFIAFVLILVGEFALEMVFAYWYVTAIMSGLMTLAVTENTRKSAIVAGLAAVIGFGGNYFVNSDMAGAISSQGGVTGAVQETKPAEQTDRQNKPAPQSQETTNDEKTKAGQGESGEQTKEQAKEKATGQVKERQEEKAEKTKERAKKPAAGTNEVALGGLSLGMSQSQAAEILGAESEVIRSPLQTRYRYADADVMLNGKGVVIGFASNSDKLATPRGIRQGSSLEEVLAAYGKPGTVSERDGADLYEYSLTAPDHKPCLLRFAVVNSQVEYISGRLLE